MCFITLLKKQTYGLTNGTHLLSVTITIMYIIKHKITGHKISKAIIAQAGVKQKYE